MLKVPMLRLGIGSNWVRLDLPCQLHLRWGNFFLCVGARWRYRSWRLLWRWFTGGPGEYMVLVVDGFIADLEGQQRGANPIPD